MRFSRRGELFCLNHSSRSTPPASQPLLVSPNQPLMWTEMRSVSTFARDVLL